MIYRRSNETQLSDCANCDHKSTSFFCHLTHEDLQEISVNKTSSIYKKGQVIFHEGNRPHGLYCIYEGKVKLYRMCESGKEQIIRLAGKGDILGYRSLVSNEKYYNTATAIEDSLICHVSIESFNRVLDSSSGLNEKLMKLLTKDVKETENRIINISQKNVSERIAEALIILKDVYGTEEDGKTLNIRITRKEVGDIANVTTESTIRKFSDFKKEGLIDLVGKKIIILDILGLTRAAELHD